MRLPAAVLVLLAAALVFLLFTVAVVVVPARDLPPRVAAAVDGRREHLMFIALCALSLSAVLVLLVALASS